MLSTSMYGCQQNLISPNQDLKAVLEYICSESNKIYNCATYHARQLWLKAKKIANRAQLCSAMVDNPQWECDVRLSFPTNL